VTHDRVADAATLVSGGCVAVGITIGEINQYLQAAAFLVAIVSGSCAAFYYVRRARHAKSIGTET
jgi:hypothetical protein